MKLYDILSRPKWLSHVVLVIVAAVLGLLACRLSFSENITEFLPLDDETRIGMEVYSAVSGANRIPVIFSGEEEEALMEAVDSFVCAMAASHPDVAVIGSIDGEDIADVTAGLYSVAPVLLTDDEFNRACTVMMSADSVSQRMERMREEMMLPGGTFSTTRFTSDPLGIFNPVLGRAARFAPQSNMDTDDGYIFLPGRKEALAIVTSPYPAQETAMNARFIAEIDSAAAQATHTRTGVTARCFGAIPIAVTNAAQIKEDSIISVAVAVVLIAVVLIMSFARRRNLLLILITVAFGMLFALGIMAVVRQEISLIVVGISAVIVGIAVNYPLHFITHSDDGKHPRVVLKELAKPLIIGNITTVGAFLCLLPLKSRALQDLGLFSALLLVGSIIFVIFFLPHMVSVSGRRDARDTAGAIKRIANARIERRRTVMYAILALTVLFAFFSVDTAFDTDLRNINYLTEQQRDDMRRMEAIANGGHDNSMSVREVLLISHGATTDDALAAAEAIDVMGLDVRNPSSMRPSSHTIAERLKRWNEFATINGGEVCRAITNCADSLGFDAEAFAPFTSMLSATMPLPDMQHIDETFVEPYAVRDSVRECILVSRLRIDKDSVATLSGRLDGTETFLYDVNVANAQMATSLSDEFNYIAFACGIIVFGFLWISFGRIEISIIAFLPMALSWIWILGLMNLFGLQFNIVNIILATFIFGQGDDYTIFITEGVLYEYTYRRRMLTSFKTGILISAIIMFIGIGALVLAEHPALKSLAWVTILGMGTVVLMAYVVPPYVFGLLTMRRGEARQYPITISWLFRRKRPLPPFASADEAIPWIRARYIYKGVGVEHAVAAALKRIAGTAMSTTPGDKALLCNDTYGCGAMLYALLHPHTEVTVVIDDAETRSIVEGLSHRPGNMHIVSEIPHATANIIDLQ